MSPLYASSRDYRAAFDALRKRGISPNYWTYLRAHLALAKRPITWRQLGVSMGFPEKTAHTRVNLQYGSFAKLLARELPPSEPPFWLHLLAEWEGQDRRGEQRFIMRSEVVAALKDFSWPTASGPGGRDGPHAASGEDAAEYSQEVATDSGDPPSRVVSTATRIVRDTAVVRELKALHRDTCQRCGKRLKIRGERFYSEGHHLKPLGDPHRGPDIRSNIVVLCPDCHVLLDFAAVALTAAQLRTKAGHSIAKEYLAYHNDLVKRGPGA